MQKKNSVVVFAGTVQPGEAFSFSCTDNGTLSTDIRIYIDGVGHTRIHTSCSQPIGPGLISLEYQGTVIDAWVEVFQDGADSGSESGGGSEDDSDSGNNAAGGGSDKVGDVARAGHLVTPSGSGMPSLVTDRRRRPAAGRLIEVLLLHPSPTELGWWAIRGW